MLKPGDSIELTPAGLILAELLGPNRGSPARTAQSSGHATQPAANSWAWMRREARQVGNWNSVALALLWIAGLAAIATFLQGVL